MNAAVDITMTFPTMERFQKSASPLCHSPRTNMGKWGVKCPITTENLTISTPESKSNKSMKASRTAPTVKKDRIIDAIHHTLHPQQWGGYEYT